MTTDEELLLQSTYAPVSYQIGEPEPERWATYQPAPPEEPETPEVAPGMDDASRWASGKEADARGNIQSALGIRAAMDVLKLGGAAMLEEEGDGGDTGEEPPLEWYDWTVGEGNEFLVELAGVTGVMALAKRAWQATPRGGIPAAPYHEALTHPTSLLRSQVNWAYPETVALGRRYSPGVRGLLQRGAPLARTAVAGAIAAAPAALPWAVGALGAWNFARGVKKIFDDDPARDLKDASFHSLMGPIGPGDYNPDSPPMQYLRDNPDAAAALHAAGVLSTPMMDHLQTSEM